MPHIEENAPVAVDPAATTKTCTLCGRSLVWDTIVVAWLNGDIGFFPVWKIPKGVEVYCCTRLRAPYCD